MFCYFCTRIKRYMKNIILGVFAISLVNISCKKDEKPTYIAEDPAATNNIAQTPNTSAQTTPVNNVPGAVQISPNSPQVQNFQVPNKNAAPVVTAPGMNPPHGEPGHRCDIPVGQPLNSKPAAQNMPTTAPQAVPAPAAPQQAAPTGVKPKTNPAHGEPWHDCALKVGDPLP